jgi:hypothetical protein
VRKVSHKFLWHSSHFFDADGCIQVLSASSMTRLTGTTLWRK